VTDQLQISPSLAAAYRIVVKAGLRRRRRLAALAEAGAEDTVLETEETVDRANSEQKSGE